jgi:hypothetical protein
MPGLRRQLGLEPPTMQLLMMVSASVFISWGMAEFSSRLLLSSTLKKPSEQK